MKAKGGFAEFIQKNPKKKTRRSTFEIPAEADLTSWLQSGEMDEVWERGLQGQERNSKIREWGEKVELGRKNENLADYDCEQWG